MCVCEGFLYDRFIYIVEIDVVLIPVDLIVLNTDAYGLYFFTNSLP